MVFLEYVESILGSFYFILPATLLSFFLKLGILTALMRKTVTMDKAIKPLFFLGAILVGNMFSDIVWVLKSCRELYVFEFSYQYALFVVRIAWVFFIVQYQSMSLFIESLVTNHYTFPLRQKLFFVISSLFGLFFTIIAVIDFDCIDRAHRKFPFESTVQNLATFYALFLVVLPSLCIAIQKIRQDILPHLLKKQLRLFLQGLLAPVFLAELIQLFPFKVYGITWIAHSYAGVGFSTILITVSIYFCTRKIFGLRFLNLKSHVQQPMNINFIDDFKTVLERLSSVTSFKELGHITQNFFKETFKIPSYKTRLYLRKMDVVENTVNINISEDSTASLD